MRDKVRALIAESGFFVSSTMKVFVHQHGALLYEAKSLEDLHSYMVHLTTPATEYDFHTTPYEHQREIFEQSKDRKNFALLMEMGTGKTKVAIDTAAYLYEFGKIKNVIVFAPNGVHRNWIQEVRIHMPPRIPRVRGYWDSKAKKKDREEFEEVLQREGLIKIVAFNIESILTKKVQEIVNALIKEPTLLIIDESTRIKNPDAKRTKLLIELGTQVEYKRILTGTPVTQSPLDLFSQFGFLDKKILGFSSFIAFRNRYAEYHNPALLRELVRVAGPDGATIYQQRQRAFVSNEFLYRLGIRDIRGIQIILRTTPIYVRNYKNMEELHGMIEPHSSRVLKKDCLDLPEKLYIPRSVKMSVEQARTYESVKTLLRAELEGQEMNITHTLTKLLRLQQICGGFFQGDGQEEPQPLNKKNPKIEALKEIIEDIGEDKQVIIWARFIPEIKAIEDALENTVTYYGATSSEDRVKAIEDFQAGEKRIFIGNQSAAGIGITLTAASYVIYFSNSFSLEDRLQSEDRAHRIGQRENVTYIDLIMENTIDQKVTGALRDKKSIADLITQDGIGEIL